MLWDSILPAYPCLESYHWHRGHTSKRNPCFASQVCARCSLRCTVYIVYTPLTVGKTVNYTMLPLYFVSCYSLSATPCPTGGWTVEEVPSPHVQTHWKLSCFPLPPLSPSLTFLPTQDHQKPGAHSNIETVLTRRAVKPVFELRDFFFSAGFRSISQNMTVIGMTCVGLSWRFPSLSITQVGLCVLVIWHWTLIILLKSQH